MIGSCCEGAAEPELAAEPVEAEAGMLLFMTATCPNCKMAIALLDKAGMQYEKLIANDHVDLVEKYGIKQAPTLVVTNPDGFEKFKGVSEIKGWLTAQK